MDKALLNQPPTSERDELESVPSKKRKKECSDFTSNDEEMSFEARREEQQLRFYNLASTIVNTDTSSLFSMVDTLLDKFVASSGNNMTIDNDFILRFPLTQYHSLYRRMGSNTKSLTVSYVTQDVALNLLTLFPNIENLILEGMDIGERIYVRYPAGLQFLKFSKCFSINNRLLPRYFAEMSLSLHSIHFDRVYCDNVKNTRNNYMVHWSSCIKIRNIIFEAMDTELWADITEACAITWESLTFRNTTGDISLPKDLPNLKQLTIENCCRHTKIIRAVNAPALEHLSLKGIVLHEIPLVVDSDHVHPLKSLECFTTYPIRRIDNILKLTKLEQVKVYCEWFHVEDLRHNFASLERIESYDVTSSLAPTIGSSLIHSVDNDSLRQIISYLPEEDLDSLALVHPKFVPLMPWVKINSKFLESYPPENMNFYQEIGSQVRELVFTSIGAIKFNEIMPYFTNLKTLDLIDIDNSSAELMNLDLIPSLEVLELSCETVSQTRSEQWISVFRRLNRNLKCVSIQGERKDTIISCLNELTNLKQFILLPEGNLNGNDFMFLKQNKNLTGLICLISKHTICHFETPSLISKFVNAENIRCLKLFFLNTEKDLTIIFNTFKNVECLTLYHKTVQRNINIQRLSLDKLIKLTLLRYAGTTSTLLELFRHFSNLKWLNVEFQSSLTGRWITKLSDALDSEKDSKFSLTVLDNNTLLLTREK